MADREPGIHLGGTARSTDDVKRLHELELQFAEIPINDPESFQHSVEIYRKLRDRLGLYYLCHGPREGDPNDMLNLEKSYLPKILALLPLIKILKIPLLTIHLWMDTRHVKEAVFAFKVKLLKKIVDRATDAGVILCLENLSERAADLEVPFVELPALNMTLDLGHAQLLTENNRAHEFIERYPERIKHIHIHDNRGGKSHLDDLHLPPGKGIIDFGGIFKNLKGKGYSRTITMELKPREIAGCLGYVKKLVS